MVAPDCCVALAAAAAVVVGAEDTVAPAEVVVLALAEITG